MRHDAIQRRALRHTVNPPLGTPTSTTIYLLFKYFSVRYLYRTKVVVPYLKIVHVFLTCTVHIHRNLQGGTLSREMLMSRLGSGIKTLRVSSRSMRN